MEKEKKTDDTAFDAVVSASRQLGLAIRQLSKEQQETEGAIQALQNELEQHYLAPLPESDLVNFFNEFIDVASERGKSVIRTQVEGILFPARYGDDFNRAPLNFREICSLLSGKPLSSADSIVIDKLTSIVPQGWATGEHNLSAFIGFVLKTQIKNAVAEFLYSTGGIYRNKEAGGLPLQERRARIAEIEAEIATLKTAKAEIERKLAELRGVVNEAQ